MGTEPPPGITLSKIEDILDGSAGDGWTSLFDGETLDGWKANENPGTWKVEDGAMVCQGPLSHLFYVGEAEPFVNFEFVCQVMTTPGANSGIYFHTKHQDSGFLKKGLEAQVNVSGKDPRKTGSLCGAAAVTDPPCRDNEYFTQQIVVQGKRVVVAINGETVVDYTEPEGTHSLGAGTFALQGWGSSKVYFRNIFVKGLP